MKKIKPYIPYIIGLIVFVSFFSLGRKLWLLIFPKDPDKKSPEEIKIISDAVKDSAVAVAAKDKTAISKDEAKQIAIKIKSHLDGITLAGVYDGYESVSKLLIGRKKADMVLIYASFGYPDISPWPFISDYQPLAVWLKKAFNNSNYLAMKDAFGSWPEQDWK